MQDQLASQYTEVIKRQAISPFIINIYSAAH